MLKILCISDTHDEHERLRIQACDILIHSGDATSTGSHRRMVKFGAWLSAQPAKHIIFVPGNHDRIAEENWSLFKGCFDPAVHLLNNDMVEIEGLKIWGCPYTPAFCNWAFQAEDGDEDGRYPSLFHMTGRVDEADIIVTHGPPKGILDITDEGESIGSRAMRKLVDRVQPKLYVCGHCHTSFGRMTGVHPSGKKTTFINASSVIEGDGWDVLGVQDPVAVYL